MHNNVNLFKGPFKAWLIITIIVSYSESHNTEGQMQTFKEVSTVRKSWSDLLKFQKFSELPSVGP